jgi:protein-disulfide isomerase
MENQPTPLQTTIRHESRGMSLLSLAILPFIFLLGLGVGYLIWGRNTGSAISNSQAAAEVTEAPQPIQRYDVPEDGDPSVGPADAAITIIEFSDFECPYCRKWQLEVWPQLQKEYGNQVRLVYRDFPLYGLHANAAPAAQAANCAGDQEKYWQFHDKLFTTDETYSVELYQQFATDLGMNVEDFNACLSSGKYAEEVQADYDWAANLGIQSTPTFFINGIPMVGAQPFESFKSLIDKELAGELPN